jgi:hypothetical protein
MKQSSEETDQMKQKVSQKDFFIQNQAKKLQQSQAEGEKFKNMSCDLERQVKVLIVHFSYMISIFVLEFECQFFKFF